MVKLWGTGTTRTLRPIWVAEELGVPYELISMGPRTGETQTKEFTEKNPKQKIPLLTDKAYRLSESLAICRYLVARFDDRGIFYAGDSHEERASLDSWCCYIYGEIDETGLYVMRRHGDLHAIYGDAPAAMTASAAYVARHLAVLSSHLAQQPLIMSGFSLADVMLMSCLDWAEHCHIGLSQPLLRYREVIRDRPAYKVATKRNYQPQGH